MEHSRGTMMSPESLGQYNESHSSCPTESPLHTTVLLFESSSLSVSLLSLSLSVRRSIGISGAVDIEISSGPPSTGNPSISPSTGQSPQESPAPSTSSLSSSVRQRLFGYSAPLSVRLFRSSLHQDLCSVVPPLV